MKELNVIISNVDSTLGLGNEIYGIIEFIEDGTKVCTISFGPKKDGYSLVTRETGEYKVEDKVFISTTSRYNAEVLRKNGITFIKGHITAFKDAYKLDASRKRIACNATLWEADRMTKDFFYYATSTVTSTTETATATAKDDFTLDEDIFVEETPVVEEKPAPKYVDSEKINNLKWQLHETFMKAIGLAGELCPAELNRISDTVSYMVNEDLPFWNHFQKETSVEDYITNTVRYAWAYLGRTKEDFEQHLTNVIKPMFNTYEFNRIIDAFKKLPGTKGNNINRRQIFINGPVGSGKSYIEKEWIANNFGIQVDDNGKDGDLVFVEDQTEFDSGKVRHLVLNQDYVRFTMHPEIDSGMMDSYYTATDGFKPSALLEKLKGVEYKLKDGNKAIRKLRLLQLEEINHANPTVINWIGQLTDNSERYTSMAVNDEYGNPYTVELPKDFLVLTTGNCYDIAGNPIGNLPWFFISRSLYNLYIERTEGLKKSLSHVDDSIKMSLEDFEALESTLNSLNPEKFIKEGK